MAFYVVTGGYGFVGGALVSTLRAAGHDVTVAARRAPPGSHKDWIEFDLVDHASIRRVVDLKPDGLFHLAWSTTPGSAERNPAADIGGNLAGTILLLDHMAQSHAAPVVLASSGGAVYGATASSPIPETHERTPIGIYGMTKHAMELYAAHCRLFSDLDVRVARISNPFGVGQSKAAVQGAATIFARKIVAEEPIEIWGDGLVVRDYVDVSDVARGLATIMSVPRHSAEQDLAFNIGSGQGLSLRDLIAILEQAAKKPAKVSYRDQRAFDIPVNILDVSKLKQAGWAPGDLHNQLGRLIEFCVAELR